MLPLEVALCAYSRDVQQQFNLIKWQIQSDMLTNRKKGTKAAASHWSRAHPWVPWGLLSHIPSTWQQRWEGCKSPFRAVICSPAHAASSCPAQLHGALSRAAKPGLQMQPACFLQETLFFSILTSKSQCLHEELLTEMMQGNCTSLQHLWG